MTTDDIKLKISTMAETARQQEYAPPYQVFLPYWARAQLAKEGCYRIGDAIIMNPYCDIKVLRRRIHLALNSRKVRTRKKWRRWLER